MQGNGNGFLNCRFFRRDCLRIFILISFLCLGLVFKFMVLSELEIMTPSYLLEIYEKETNHSQITRNVWELYPQNSTEATLARKVKVLCWILTMPENHDNKALAVKRTWCSEICDLTESQRDMVIGVRLVGASAATVTNVVGFKHSTGHTMIAPEEQAITHMAMNMGIVNTEKRIDTQACSKHSQHKYASKCMAEIDAEFVDTRDEQGRERFHPDKPDIYLRPGPFPQWYDWGIVHKLSKGMNQCCADKTISFHYVDWTVMYALHFATYRLNPISSPTHSNNTRRKSRRKTSFNYKLTTTGK
ncbi:hypothetical protein C0J52_02803 [Blattella germanica]|nr:hypothetical protein C0J52_02803 [Blattella germanica]